MKKIIVFIFMLLLFPLDCFAVQGIEIDDTILKGPSTAKEGETFVVEIGGIYTGLNRNEYGVDGIYEAGALFEFDDSVLAITELYTDYYDSAIVKIDDQYVIGSIADETENNKCADKFLDCTSYSARVVFYVKDTDAEEVKIKLNSLYLGTFTVNSDKDYYEDDMKEVICDNEKTITIKIEQTNKAINVPDSIVSDKLPEVNDDTIRKSLEKKEENTDEKNESNEDENSPKQGGKLFLKDLKIKNHKIDFNNTTSTYSLLLDSSTNKLDIEAIPYYKDTSIKIVGADNLKAYSDIVKVRVELSNHDKMTYIININRESISSAESASIMNKLNSVGICIIGVVSLIVFIVLICGFRDKKKLKKLLEDNENEVI